MVLVPELTGDAQRPEDRREDVAQGDRQRVDGGRDRHLVAGRPFAEAAGHPQLAPPAFSASRIPITSENAMITPITIM